VLEFSRNQNEKIFQVRNLLIFINKRKMKYLHVSNGKFLSLSEKPQHVARMWRESKLSSAVARIGNK
jgi:hypothetical protein